MIGGKCKLILILILSTIYLRGQHRLYIPDTLGGSEINLHLQKGHHVFYESHETTTIGINGHILGPTLIIRKGEHVKINVNNQLGETSTLHWHGLHVAPENDGGPHTPIADGVTWSPSFEVYNNASTCWYHPHLHHKTNEHVTKGISGMIIVQDEEEKNLLLPRTYGIDDIPMIIQTKDFDVNKEIVVHSNSDDVVMVNATINPYIHVPAQMVRCRIVNGSSQRAFNLGLSNNHNFYQIATDGGLLSTPYTTKRLMIAPGERVEILIDFNEMNGQTLHLMSYASELPNGIYGATNPGMAAMMTLDHYNPNPLNGKNFNILTFNVSEQNANPVTIVPATLSEVHPIDETLSNKTRVLTFSPMSMGMNQLNGDFTINNAPFDMEVVNFEIPLNNIEIWELRNQSAISHPFHIHDIQFYILSRNGQNPAENEKGLKDVVLVRPGETIRFITKFETFANPHLPYMYHCHLLTHEDGGMMGQFKVTERTSSTENEINNQSLKVHLKPNPALSSIEVEYSAISTNEFKVTIYDIQGNIFFNQSHSFYKDQNLKVDISTWSAGAYFVKIGDVRNNEIAGFVKK